MQRKYLILCLALAGLLVASLAIDLPVSRWLALGSKNDAHPQTPGEVKKLLALSETFSHGTGVVLILLTIYVVIPEHRRYLLRLTCSSFGAGLAANLVKLFVLRTRPARLGLIDFTGDATDTFAGFAFVNSQSATQSFPSAHTATAVGLAIGLSFVYPRGKWLFSLFAILAGLQRIQFLHHYPSDVLAGALLGTIVAGLINSDTRVGRSLLLWEERSVCGFDRVPIQ